MGVPVPAAMSTSIIVICYSTHREEHIRFCDKSSVPVVVRNSWESLPIRFLQSYVSSAIYEQLQVTSGESVRVVRVVTNKYYPVTQYIVVASENYPSTYTRRIQETQVVRELLGNVIG